MITLYNFGPFHGIPDASPFCVKADLYMRLAGIEFTSDSGFHHARKAPKGKLPVIDDDGKIIPDSAFIMDHLKHKYGDVLDEALNSEQKAIAHGFIKMIEENLYWCMVYSRWIDEQGWATIKDDFFGQLPFPLKVIIPVVARKGVRKSLHLQGLGRHSDKEILEIARKDFSALSSFLGSNEYFLINTPTTLDVVAFAQLAEFIVPPIKNEMNDLAKSFDNLVSFVDRIKEKYYTAN